MIQLTGISFEIQGSGPRAHQEARPLNTRRLLAFSLEKQVIQQTVSANERACREENGKMRGTSLSIP